MAESPTVESLADQAAVDNDHALIRLWDAGLDYLSGPTDQIRGRDLGRARSALSIASAKQKTRVNYWLRRLDFTRTEFVDHLHSKFDVALAPNARVLPKGCLRKLERLHSEDLDLTPSFEPEPSERRGAFEWGRRVGTRCDVDYLEVEEVRQVHFALVEVAQNSNDPISPAGVKSENTLGSSVYRCQTGMQGHLKYPTVEMAGAALLHSLTLGHAFHNGNKRTALVSLMLFLDRNRKFLQATEDELFELVVRLAAHYGETSTLDGTTADREVMHLADWIFDHTRPLVTGQRPMSWRKLERILRDHGCLVDSHGVGNRISVTRTITVRKRGFFPTSRTMEKSLHCSLRFAGLNSEVDKITLTQIRKDLELDDHSGVDARSFYEEPAEPDDFIVTNMQLLARLGRI